MLARFNVGNFLSFKDVQEFSLLKGRNINKSNRIFDNKKLKLLKFASVFGTSFGSKSQKLYSTSILSDFKKGHKFGQILSYWLQNMIEFLCKEVLR